MQKTDLAAELAQEARRVVDRLRTSSLVALAAPAGEGSSRAQAAYDTAVLLASYAAGLEGGPQRTLPRLPDSVVADQLAVTAADLLDVAGNAQDQLAEALGALRRLRAVL